MTVNGSIYKTPKISGGINSQNNFTCSLNPASYISGSLGIPKIVIPKNYGKITYNGSVITIT